MILYPRIISKICFLMYIVYSNVASYSLFFVKGLSPLLLVVALVTELYSDGFKIKANRSFISYLIFTIYILASGFVIAKDFNLVLSTTFTFIESLAVFCLILSYVFFDRKVAFVMNVFVAQALLAAFIVIINGVGVKRMSIADRVNVNTIGVMLAYAIGFILFMIIKEKQKSITLVISFACIALLIIGILLAVSKKAIFASGAMILLWLIICYKVTLKKINILYRIIIFIVIIAIAVFAIGWYANNYTFQLQILKTRMDQLYSGDSDQDRIKLFIEGFEIFLSHPFFGVGFNNSRFHSFRSTYTHSLYSEVFACTGIIGALIFLYGLFNPYGHAIRLIRKNKDDDSIELIKLKYVLALFSVLLVLNFVQILFYQPTLMYILAVLTAYVTNLYNRDADESVAERGELDGNDQTKNTESL